MSGRRDPEQCLLLDSSDLLRLFDTDYQVLYSWVKKGFLPCLQFRRRMFFRYGDVVKMVERLEGM